MSGYYISPMHAKIWFEIAPSRQAKAVESFWGSALRNYGLVRANSLSEANAVLCYGQVDSEFGQIPVIHCPVLSTEWLPKILAVEPNTGFVAPHGAQWSKTGVQVNLNFDLFSFLAGTLFLAEEYQSKHYETSRDAQSTGLLAQRFGFLDKPYVDQWVRWVFEQLLGGRILVQSVWEQKGLHFWMTHDVDQLLRWNWKRTCLHLIALPFQMFYSPKRTWQLTKSLWSSRVKSRDPLDQIDTVIQCDEPRPSSFFVLGWPKDHLVARYDVRQKRFKKTLSQIPKSGREVGLHGSPLHPQSAELLSEEVRRIRQSLDCPVRMSRMHFLRFDLRKTPRALIQAGIEMDSSLGFNDRPGFRCGSAMPFRWFDLEKDEELPLVMVPLVFADHQRQEWLHAAAPEFIEEMLSYVRKCREVGAPCTVLMHDLYFANMICPGHPEFYAKILSELDREKIQWMEAREMLFVQGEF